MHAAQFSQRFVGLAHLALEQRDLPEALFRRQFQGVLARASRLRLDHLADLGEREAELLALQNESQPVPVRAAEDALAPLAHRREQAAALIEAQRTQRDAELLGEIRDAEFALVRVLRLIFRINPEYVPTLRRIVKIARMH